MGAVVPQNVLKNKSVLVIPHVDEETGIGTLGVSGITFP